MMYPMTTTKSLRADYADLD